MKSNRNNLKLKTVQKTSDSERRIGIASIDYNLLFQRMKNDCVDRKSMEIRERTVR